MVLIAILTNTIPHRNKAGLVNLADYHLEMARLLVVEGGEAADLTNHIAAAAKQHYFGKPMYSAMRSRNPSGRHSSKRLNKTCNALCRNGRKYGNNYRMIGWMKTSPLARLMMSPYCNA